MTTHTSTTRRLAVAVLGLLAGVLALTATPATALPVPTCHGEPATIVITVPGLVTIGTDDADVIVGTNGDDTIRADDGDDLVCGRDGFDTIFGGADNDTIYGGNFNDSLHGDDGDDVLFGGRGGDNVFGDADNDVLDCGPGNLDTGDVDPADAVQPVSC